MKIDFPFILNQINLTYCILDIGIEETKIEAQVETSKTVEIETTTEESPELKLNPYTDKKFCCLQHQKVFEQASRSIR
jgi:hypothetical protein